MDFCRRVFFFFFLAIAALIAISLIYGLERLDRFEVAVISIYWLVLMVNGVLLSILFKRQRGIETHQQGGNDGRNL